MLFPTDALGYHGNGHQRGTHMNIAMSTMYLRARYVPANEYRSIPPDRSILCAQVRHQAGRIPNNLGAMLIRHSAPAQMLSVFLHGKKRIACHESHCAGRQTADGQKEPISRSSNETTFHWRMVNTHMKLQLLAHVPLEGKQHNSVGAR